MSLHAIVEAANDLAALLEATRRRGLNRQRHVYHLAPARAKIEAVMRHYFARQERAVMAAIRPHIERELLLHPQESITPQGSTFARALLPSSLQPLTFAATANESSDYADAIAGLIAGAASTLAKEIGRAAPDSESIAASYLRNNSLSKLTGDIADTSIERLQDALATAWDKGGDYDSMVAAVKETFVDFSETRAETIAQTESNAAYNEGRSETAKAMGAIEKGWETESDNPCPDCLENEAAGFIDVDDEFPAGDEIPLHPNCACTLNFKFDE